MKSTTHFSLVMQNYRHCVQKRRLTYDTLSYIININKHADIKHSCSHCTKQANIPITEGKQGNVVENKKFISA